MTVQRILPFVAVAVVVGGLVWAFATIGTPGRARLAALDRVRAANLYEIAQAMNGRFERSALPAALPPDLRPRDIGIVGARGNFTDDPATGTQYEYRRLDQNRYRMCATFALAYRPVRPEDLGWRHPSGHACFDFDTRKDPLDPSVIDGIVEGSPPF